MVLCLVAQQVWERVGIGTWTHMNREFDTWFEDRIGLDQDKMGFPLSNMLARNDKVLNQKLQGTSKIISNAFSFMDQWTQTRLTDHETTDLV